MARTGCRLLVLTVCLAAAPWLAQATTDCTWKPECPATGTVKYPIPCKNNCQRYFQCTNGVLTTEACFGTRRFNHELLTCQWYLGFTGDCDWFLWNDATQIKCPFEPQCPAKGKSKIALPCEGQCNQYVDCKDGRWKVETCSYAHQMFDHVTGECRTKSAVDCNWWKPTESPTQKPTEEPRPSNPTAPPASPTSSTASPTAPPASPTLPPASPTAPPASPTSPPASPTSPPASPTSPPASPTSPPASPTSPPAGSTAPPSSEPAPTTPTEVTTPSPKPICGQPPKCPEKGHARLPVPCPNACQRYYECQDGKYTEMSCKPWESFDPVKAKCTLFYGVDCSQYGPSKPPPTSKPDKPADKPCDFKPACPASGSVKIADPCPKKCQWYYECNRGKAVSKQCLPWENFDPVSLLCTLFWTVDCTWGQHVTPTPSGPPPTTTPAAPTTPKPFIPGCSFRPECPAAGSAKLAIPCPNHCSEYVQCTNGKPTIESCSLFRNFDHKSLSCAFWGVDCKWYEKPQPTKPSLLMGKLLRS